MSNPSSLAVVNRKNLLNPSSQTLKRARDFRFSTQIDLRVPNTFPKFGKGIPHQCGCIPHHMRLNIGLVRQTCWNGHFKPHKRRDMTRATLSNIVHAFWLAYPSSMRLQKSILVIFQILVVWVN